MNFVWSFINELVMYNLCIFSIMYRIHKKTFNVSGFVSRFCFWANEIWVLEIKAYKINHLLYLLLSSKIKH